MKHRLFCLLASALGPPLIWLLCRFVRVHTEGFEALERFQKERRPYIFALWHSCLFYLSYDRRARGTAVMVSRSRDGEYIARVLTGLGHVAVRGSSSRGGLSALRALAEEVRGGRPAAITVDGPRGPARVVKAGVIQLAALSGAPILPVTFDCRPAWRLASWDRFLLPRGYGRGILLIGAPISVPSACSNDGMEEKRLELQRALDGLSARAERYWDDHAEVSQD